MLEKLLSLLLHAKGGAVATVFVLGTTGALVTATIDNGLTTITITQPSATTTGSETTTPGGSTTTTNTTVTETILALFTRTNAEDDPTGTATGKGCSDEAHETNALVKEVNDAFKGFHQEVARMHKDARTADARDAVKEADKGLKATRQAAVKFFHEAFDCDHEDEDDLDEDDEDDLDSDDEDDNGAASTGTTVAFSGDPEIVADLAISAMKLQVENLKKALADMQSSTTPSAQNTRKAETSNRSGKDKDKHENRGKGHDRDDDEDDD